MTQTADECATLDTTLTGIDEAVATTVERAEHHAARIADEREGFDADSFEVSDAYVFGSVAAGTGTPGESDLDVCLCVPPWESPGDFDHPAAYRPVVDEIMERLRDESDTILPSSVLDGGVTRLDVWVAEPAYNADHLADSVPAPVYFPDTGERVSPGAAAERVRQRDTE